MAKVQRYLVSLCYFQVYLFDDFGESTLVSTFFLFSFRPVDRNDLVSLPSALRQGAEGGWTICVPRDAAPDA